jgi:G protein beta subunit-like protein
VNKLEITSDKKLIAAAGNSHIKLFDVNSNSPQETFHYEGHQGNVTAVGFQKDNRWMYTGGWGRGEAEGSRSALVLSSMSSG